MSLVKSIVTLAGLVVLAACVPMWPLFGQEQTSLNDSPWKVAPQCDVSETGEMLSAPGYNSEKWLAAHVPGETKRVTIEYAAASVGGETPNVEVECWNNFPHPTPTKPAPLPEQVKKQVLPTS